MTSNIETKCGAPKGNEFWKARTKHGRKPKFENAEHLWELCCAYFEWVVTNPMYESKAFSYQGELIMADVPKMRVMTIRGLTIYLNIHHSTWIEYKKKKGFSDITRRIENIIYVYKFEGVAANLLNSNIIARDLGMKRNKKLTTTKGQSAGLIIYVPSNQGE